MITDSVQAWLLHKQPLGDTSLKVIFYAREQGVISCHYKGGRLPTKQLLLQPFTHLWLSVSQRATSNWYDVRQVEHCSPPLTLKGISLFAGLYTNELLYYLLDDSEPYSTFYETYAHTLQALAMTVDRLEIEAILRHFEYRLLQICGYAFSYTYEAYSDKLIESQKHYAFVAGQGFVSDKAGLLGSDILALGESSLNNAYHLKLAKYIMRQAISHALDGRRLISRSLFNVGVNKPKKR